MTRIWHSGIQHVLVALPVPQLIQKRRRLRCFLDFDTAYKLSQACQQDSGDVHTLELFLLETCSSPIKSIVSYLKTLDTLTRGSWATNHN